MISLKNVSETEQMYLMTIAMLGENSQAFPVPVSQLAEALKVTPISANQMIHHLQEVNLVCYLPYKGVELTESGWEIARKILRARRLWEVFLVEHLAYDPEQAEILACDLEHAIPAETAERLFAFLGQPEVSPKGKPIPLVSPNPLPPLGVPLSTVNSGLQAQIMALPAQDPQRGFLERAGLQTGQLIRVLAVHPQVAVLVQAEPGPALDLTYSIAQDILVETKQ